jgi:hypothetical protein
MMQRKVEDSLMGIGVGAMGVGGVVPSEVGVEVVSSLLPLTRKQLSFQLLNLDSFKFKVNQT